MSSEELPFPLNSVEYRQLRHAQSEKLYASQLEGLSKRFQTPPPQDLGEATTVRSHRDLGQERFPKPSIEICSKAPPYSAGSPAPTYILSQPDQFGASAIAGVSLGDPITGRLSVSFNGGNFLAGGFANPTTPDSLPMPERWLLGDAISSSAAVLQAVPLLRAHTSGVLVAEVEFGWEPDVYASAPDVGYGQDPTPNYLGSCLDYLPGTSASPLGGFVGFAAYVEVTATVLSGLNVLASNAIASNILILGINAQLTGDAFNDSDQQYLFRDFVFDGPEFGNAVSLSTNVPLGERADALVVEASVRLVGFRGGVNDPNAGWVNGGFVFLQEGTPNVGGIQNSAPIAVRKMSAYLYP